MPGIGIGISPVFSRGGGADPISQALLFYYKMNGNLNRSYGTFDGAFGPTVTFEASPTSGQCAVFDGTNFGQIDDSLDFDFGAGDFSMAALVYPTAVDGNTYSFLGQCSYAGNDASFGFLMRVSASNKFVVLLKTVEGAATFCTLTSASDVIQDQWQLITIKRSGTTVTLKVNNSLEDTETMSFDYQPSLYKVGVGIPGEFHGSQFYNGKIDFFAGWSRALTNDEETELYNDGDFFKFNSSSPTPSSNNLQLRLFDPQSIGFSTFQSHNQKTVVSSYGTFIAYANGAVSFPDYDYRILRIVGNTITEIESEQSYLEPTPVLEVDSSGNIYSIKPHSNTEIECIKYSAPGFTAGTPVIIAGQQDAHKCCAYLDEANDRIYFFMENVLTVMDMDFATIRQVTVLQDGVDYGEEYPHLTGDSSGNIYLAWTTAVPASNGEYRTVHVAKTLDQGATFVKLDGTALTLPAVSDETGPTDMIYGPLEFEDYTWLSSFTYANERLHFVAISFQPDFSNNNQVYRRVNPTTGTNEVTTEDVAGNTPVKGPDSGFIRIVGGTSGSPTVLRLITSDDEKVIVLTSSNNGTSWSVAETSDNSLLDRVYSIGVYRELYDDKAWGCFTNVRSWPPAELYTATNSGYTYYLRLTT